MLVMLPLFTLEMSGEKSNKGSYYYISEVFHLHFDRIKHLTKTSDLSVLSNYPKSVVL